MIVWIAFLVIVVAILALDLGVLNRDDREPTMRQALGFTAGCVVLALVFAVGVSWAYDVHWQGLGLVPDAIDGRMNTGHTAAVKFLTGYVVELSLSIDNVFVIALIFSHIGVPPRFQHRVLFWGILGALIMRGLMIGAGAALVARYHWILYVFGAFLVLTAVKMLFATPKDEAPEERWIIRWLSRHFRVAKEFHGHDFVIVRDGVRWLTPLAVALVLVETTDVIFAVDSIPAIFAITTDPFLVFTSNVFAILCLRSLYFGLAGLIRVFRYLSVSLALILGIVGMKMLAGKLVVRWLGESANIVMLAVVLGILLAGVVASTLIKPRAPGRP
ncbi:MAG: TerC family protein [Gemmatimonadetes bacterium]|nr:TerC family protein [Gemmatimonadota bacterium]